MDLIDHKIYLIAIYEYLNLYWEQSYNDLGGFLGSLNPTIFEDLSPADPALESEWFEIIDKQEKLTPKKAYHYMFKFLNKQNNMGWPEIGEFLQQENLININEEINPEQLVRWNDAIKKALQYDVQIN